MEFRTLTLAVLTPVVACTQIHLPKCGTAGTTCDTGTDCSRAWDVLKGQRGFCNAGGCSYEAISDVPSGNGWCCYANCEGIDSAQLGKRRRLKIVNQCRRPMTITTTGGNSEVNCSSDGSCQDGMTCNPSTNECYFDLDMPESGWTIPSNSSVVLKTPNAAVMQGNGVMADWSGKLEFHANHTMDGGNAAAAICNGLTHCPTYKGVNGVSTAVEFTFVPFGPDYYDVSVINGMNIPIEMRPDDFFTHVAEEASGSKKGYNCGIAGAMSQPDSRLSSCSWSYNLTFGEVDVGPLLNQVDGGYGPCTSNAHCADGLVCGQVGRLSPGPTPGTWRPTTEVSMECGNWIGLWSVYQLCVWTGNTYKSPAPFEGLIDCPASHNMFACAGSEPWTTTCYNNPGAGECCGCADWSKVLGVAVPDGGHGCQGFSNAWTRDGLPFYSILKAGCPTSYTYAFDDETSTFTCQTAESRADALVANDAGYIITLCPKGTDAATHSSSDTPPSSTTSTPPTSITSTTSTTSSSLVTRTSMANTLSTVSMGSGMSTSSSSDAALTGTAVNVSLDSILSTDNSSVATLTSSANTTSNVSLVVNTKDDQFMESDVSAASALVTVATAAASLFSIICGPHSS